jgi:hypothetical protein
MARGYQPVNTARFPSVRDEKADGKKDAPSRRTPKGTPACHGGTMPVGETTAGAGKVRGKTLTITYDDPITIHFAFGTPSPVGATATALSYPPGIDALFRSE